MNIRARLAAASFSALLLTSSAFAVEFKVSEEAVKQHTFKSIHVAGSFNEWSSDKHPMAKEGTEWKVDIPLEDGDYEYKLVLDTGNELPAWELDPSFPVYTPDGLGGYNSALTVKDGKRAIPGEGYELFEWKDDAASSVSVAGDFDKWEPDYLKLRRGEDGTWRCHIKLERPITYKFVVNGKDWLTEKTADGVELAKDAGGIENNLRPVVEKKAEEPKKEEAAAAVKPGKDEAMAAEDKKEKK